MKLGFYTYSYIDRLKMDIEPVLEAVATAGYDGIDISATWHDDLDPALMPSEARGRYVKAASRLGLEIEAVITHHGLAQALREVVQRLQRPTIGNRGDRPLHRVFSHPGVLPPIDDIGAILGSLIELAPFMRPLAPQAWQAAAGARDAPAGAGSA